MWCSFIGDMQQQQQQASNKRTEHSDNDNEVYFILATSNSRTDKHRTVAKTHVKTTKYNAKKENDYVLGIAKNLWLVLGTFLVII